MKRFIAWFKKFGHYLWGKRSELKDMSEADILLAKVVLDIHRKRAASECITVPLFALRQIHPINRENSLLATEKRMAVLREHREKLLQLGTLSRASLHSYLPSVSAIKVVRDDSGGYIAFEGNGRLVALQQVFCPADKLKIEVEEYLFTDSAKIIRRMNRIRALHNLGADEEKAP